MLLNLFLGTRVSSSKCQRTRLRQNVTTASFSKRTTCPYSAKVTTIPFYSQTTAYTTLILLIILYWYYDTMSFYAPTHHRTIYSYSRFSIGVFLGTIILTLDTLCVPTTSEVASPLTLKPGKLYSLFMV